MLAYIVPLFLIYLLLYFVSGCFPAHDICCDKSYERCRLEYAAKTQFFYSTMARTIGRLSLLAVATHVIIIIIIIILAHQHKACRQLKIKQEMTAVCD